MRLTDADADKVQTNPVGGSRDADVDAFANAIIAGKSELAREEAFRFVANGASYEWLADILIAGTARRLGTEWEQNRISFIAVSLAISELLRMNSELRRLTRGRYISQGSLALFATLRGQSHILGIVLAAEAFRQNGWDVEMKFDSTPDDIVTYVEMSKPGVVGLTAGRSDRLDAVAALLARLKSLRPAPRTLLGGRAVADIGMLETVAHVDKVVTSVEDGLVAAGRFR